MLRGNDVEDRFSEYVGVSVELDSKEWSSGRSMRLSVRFAGGDGVLTLLDSAILLTGLITLDPS